MKSFWNFLMKNKLYGTINLVGLTVSMTFVLLLAVYVQRQLTTDSFQQNADRIYVIANEDNVTMGYWLDKHLKNNFPEIEKGCCVANIASAAAFNINGERVYGSTMAADSTFFEMFSYDLVEGNKADWLVSWDRCMVSREFANAHFSDKDPLGQIISLNYEGSFQLTVCGVYEDFGNSILKAPDVLIRGDIMPKINSSHDEYMSNAGGGVCFVMTYPGADLQARQSDILDWCEENFWVYKSQYDKVRLIPLRDMYFLNEGIRYGSDTIQFGNRSFVNLLLAMCLLLLAFAVLNYINMTTALTGFRAKEMATRRLVGADAGRSALPSGLPHVGISSVHLQSYYACQCAAGTGIHRGAGFPGWYHPCPPYPKGRTYRDSAGLTPIQDQDGLQQGHHRGTKCGGYHHAGQHLRHGSPDKAPDFCRFGIQYQRHSGGGQCFRPDWTDPAAAG